MFCISFNPFSLIAGAVVISIQQAEEIIKQQNLKFTMQKTDNNKYNKKNTAKF